MRRYHSIDFIDRLNFGTFVDLLNLAYSEDKKDKIYMQWCGMLPEMGKYMPFNEFYDTVTGKNIDTRSTEEIIAEIDSKHAAMKAKKG